jgi:hypothetical protein
MIYLSVVVMAAAIVTTFSVGVLFGAWWVVGRGR